MKHKVFICLVLAALMFSGSSVQAASGGDAVPRAEKYFPFGTSMNWGGIESLARRQGFRKRN